MLTLASPFLFKCYVNKLLWFTAELRLTFISICFYRKMSPALKFAVTQNGDKLPPDRTSTDTITLQVNICDSGQIFVHFWSSHQQFIYPYFMLIVHLVCFRCSNVCSCIVAVCRAESCSVVFSYNVVQLPCCFFLPVFAELCSRRTGLSKVFLFFFNKADF